MTSKQPKVVLIIGAARSGTTLLYETLCKHRDFAYITDRLDYDYHEKLLKVVHSPLKLSILRAIGKYNKLWRPTIRFDSAPNEGNSFWLRHLPYWKYMTEKDVTDGIRDYFTTQISFIMQSQQRNIFLNKNPHHSYRVKLLDALFPDCKFIHIIRDGRAVAYSEFIRRNHKWDDKPIIENILKDHYRPARSYLYNIGQEWNRMVLFAREAKIFGPERYFELRYEDLIRDKDSFFKILEFCNLSHYDEFAKLLPKTRDENIKWKEKLDDKQIFDIEESTFELRQQLGYS